MIELTSKDEKVDAIATLVFEGEDKEFSGEYQKIKFGSPVKLGLGKKESLTNERLKKAIGVLVKQLPLQEIKTVQIDIKSFDTKSCVEGAAVGNYIFNKYKSKNENGFLKKIYFKNAEKKAYEEALIIATATNFARDLSNEPSFAIFPESFSSIAKNTLKNVEVWDVKRLQKEQFIGTLTVGKGSVKQPRAVIIRHNKGTGKPIVLIGKGVTFDTGGYNLKTGKSMNEMYTDMSGGAAVLGTMKAVQELDLKLNIIGIIPLAENLVSGNAYKPGDIIKAMNGVTVEVGNTDAEGRLLLMDALCFAKKLDPKLTIDLATLTGAVKYALGIMASGAFTKNDELWDKLNFAGESSGDRVWRLPLWDEYDRYIKGEVADWTNSGRGTAGSITAARFLEKFAPESWIHLDIAGAARIDEDLDYFRKGSSGAGVRLLVELLKNL